MAPPVPVFPRELNVARPFAPSMVHLQLSSEQLVPVRTDTPVPI